MTWWSLCCGLDAVASWAMARRRPPASRMGGKRAFSDDVLRIIGEHPKTWHMVDADPAIVLWWSAVFGGWLGEVADRLRAYDLDGEELWRSIVYANGKDFGDTGWATVPDDKVELLAAALMAQVGNFSGVPITWREGKWRGIKGFCRQWNPAQAEVCKPLAMARRIDYWAAAAQKISGTILGLDLNAWAPDFQPGDLVTIDPPYAGTSGYSEVLSRDRVVALALMADTAGARVLVHEAEAVIEPGAASWRLEALHPNICAPERWRSLDLRKGERKNQDTWRKRGKHGAREVATINFEPAGRLGLQGELFTESDCTHDP